MNKQLNRSPHDVATTFARRDMLGWAAALALTSVLAARADEVKSLRIVVPFAAGSGSDVTVRFVADALQRSGLAAIIDNKPGAGSIVGSLDVSRSRPDGSVILYTTGAHTTNAVLMKKLPFDPIEGFTPIMMLVRSSGFALVVNGKSPYQTLAQLIAAARAAPGKLSYGSSGVGNTTHVVGALFCEAAGIDMLHVPFKGTPITELLGGTVDSIVTSPAFVAQSIETGRMRALAVSGTRRDAQLPDVPTFAELGVNVQDVPAWAGFWGPPGMSPEVVQSLYAKLLAAAHSSGLEKYVREGGGEIVGMAPQPFAAFVKEEIERYRRILPPLGIHLD